MLPTYSGDKFRWNGYSGFTNPEILGEPLDWGYVGYTRHLGFVIESHITGAKKLFTYVDSVFDGADNFISSRWETSDGISVVYTEPSDFVAVP